MEVLYSDASSSSSSGSGDEGELKVEIWRVIETIRGDGIAALIVDRHYRRVAAHAQRLVVLQKGQVALAGPADELRESAALTELLGV